MALNFEKWLSERLTEKRYRHSLAVRERAFFLAGLYGENEEKAALAGLLHDCCKCLSRNEQLKIIKSRGIIFDDFMLAHPQLWHGTAASIVVEDELGIRDTEVISAIRLHSTGAKGMTRFDMIVYLADLTSADRQYHDIQTIRDLSEQSLEKGMTYCLKHIIRMLLAGGSPIVRDTWEAYNYFCKLET